VVWFSLALSVATCILVGLAPAIGIARSEQQSALKQSGRGTTAGRASQRARQAIVAAEVAAALILLAGAWLMASSLRNLTKVDPGFDPSNVLTVRVFLPPTKYNAVQALRFYRSGLERIASLPGVKSVTVASCLPLLNNCMMEVRFDREGSARDAADRPSAPYASVSGQYFETLRIRLLRGRFFTYADNETAPPVAIVSEALAARYFPNEDPLGKRLVVSRPVRFTGEEIVRPEIVGVVANVRSDLAQESKPMIYVPHPQNPFSRGVWFAARTTGNPAALASVVRAEFLAIDKEEPVEQVGRLAQMLETQLAQPRFQTGLMGSFAVVALLLAVLGIYGVNAYAVTQRRNELGLRMALGASRGSVLRLVIWQGMLPTGIGIVLGLVGAAGATSLLRSVLVGADALDPIAFLGAALVLASAAALACYFPARRATRIDPAIILRQE
jgi:putative ABC transport system permease protein